MKCLHCDEVIGAGDDFEFINDGAAALHRECLLRQTIGSADHVRRGPHPPGTCRPDDPALTKREAAQAAVAAWMAKHAGLQRDTTNLAVEELTTDELRAEIEKRSAALETPGYFSRYGEDADNVRAAFRHRLLALGSMLDEREWPRELAAREE